MKLGHELPMRANALPLVNIQLASITGVAMHRTLILGSLISIMLAFGLTACGKRGDPYRPSDIPVKSHSQTPPARLGNANRSKTNHVCLSS